MAKYETMFITRTDIPDEEIEKLVAQMEGVISHADGKIEKVEKMGRRRLAYSVQKQREGLYLLFVFEGNPNRRQSQNPQPRHLRRLPRPPRVGKHHLRVKGVKGYGV